MQELVPCPAAAVLGVVALVTIRSCYFDDWDLMLLRMTAIMGASSPVDGKELTH